jgi:hypothetical protein
MLPIAAWLKAPAIIAGFILVECESAAITPPLSFYELPRVLILRADDVAALQSIPHLPRLVTRQPPLPKDHWSFGGPR